MAEEICKNCKKSIPSEISILHHAHCERFLYHCQKCNETMKKTLKEDHLTSKHSTVKCEYCFYSFDNCEISVHKQVCLAKNKSCLYCGAHFDLFNLTEHEDICGNRTDQCSLCGKFIRLRLLDDHTIECIGIFEKDQESFKRKPNSTCTAKKKFKQNN